MSFREASQEVEGHYFSARVNVASDFKTFCRAVASERSVQELATLLADEETAKALVTRTAQLVCGHADFRYEHPRDAAIAAYIMLLTTRYPELARVAAESVIMIPRAWWAAKMAQSVLRGDSIHSQANSKRIEMQPGDVVHVGIAALAPEGSEEQVVANYVYDCLKEGPTRLATLILGRTGAHSQSSELFPPGVRFRTANANTPTHSFQAAQ